MVWERVGYGLYSKTRTGTETHAGQFPKSSTGTERRWVDFKNGGRKRKRERVNFEKQVRQRNPYSYPYFGLWNVLINNLVITLISC